MRRRLVLATMLVTAAVVLQALPATASTSGARDVRTWLARIAAPDEPAPTPRCDIAHDHDIQVGRSGRYVAVSGMAELMCDAPIEGRISASIMDPNGDRFGFGGRCSLEDFCGGIGAGAGVGCVGGCGGEWTVTTTVRVQLVPPLPWGTVPRWCESAGVTGGELLCRYRTDLTVPKSGRITRSRAGTATALL